MLEVGGAMRIIDDLLEATCKNMIKTILFCLPHATKGTIYRIGPMPTLLAVRITSGIRKEGSDDIQWGLPSSSDYNFPGKSWEQYRDQPGRVLEAMGWCVEKEISWTADNPWEDIRSVRKQLGGETEGFYHMEPVLVRKIDIFGSLPELGDYPVDHGGMPIWQDTDYVVAAVVKIHFQPHSLRRDDRSTKIIKELSRSLGTELLSLNLRETLSVAQKEFARQRLQSCEILAHELRNTFVRFAFIFPAVNAQMAILRQYWEGHLRGLFPDLGWKDGILCRLNELIRARLPMLNGTGGLTQVCKTLLAEQEELAALSLLPSQSEQWLLNKIRPKWELLLTDSQVWQSEKEEVSRLLENLREAVFIGLNSDLASRVVDLPQDLVEDWFRLAYVYFTPNNLYMLEDVFELLRAPLLPIPQKHQIRKTLKSLKSLLDMVPQIEERTNRMIQALRFGTPSAGDTIGDLDRICRIHTQSEDQGTSRVSAVE
jgi:hypothetical protein